ncbi:MAG: preprotein translocase subunit SecE [Alphaproteobacteria bacterium]|nr:preprotein translocase subunit SecE [Alphaproteobacteria bacterium]
MAVNPAQFVRQVKQEIAKITWPGKQEIVQGTLTVVVMCAILAGFLFVVDTIFAVVIRRIIGG